MTQEIKTTGQAKQKKELIEALAAKNWGDVRSILDEHFPMPTTEINVFLGPYVDEVKFEWNKEDGWYYDDEF